MVTVKRVTLGMRAVVLCTAAIMPLLIGSVLAAPGELEEIVFASRQPGLGSHWYENFGYYAHDENLKIYQAMGRLCRLDTRSGKLTKTGHLLFSKCFSSSVACSIDIETGFSRNSGRLYCDASIAFSVCKLQRVPIARASGLACWTNSFKLS